MGKKRKHYQPKETPVSTENNQLPEDELLDAVTDASEADAAPVDETEEVLEQEDVVEEQVSEPVPEPEPEATPPVADRGETATIQHYDEAPFISAKPKSTVVMALEEYASEMAPGKPQTRQSIAANQRMLFRLFLSIIQSEGAVFGEGMRNLLAFIHEHRDGVFKETSIYRGIHDPKTLGLSKNETRTFQHLLNLFLNTADPKGRAMGLRQVDLGAALKHVTNEGVRQRIAAFYHL